MWAWAVPFSFFHLNILLGQNVWDQWVRECPHQLHAPRKLGYLINLCLYSVEKISICCPTTYPIKWVQITQQRRGHTEWTGDKLNIIYRKIIASKINFGSNSTSKVSSREKNCSGPHKGAIYPFFIWCETLQ